MDMPLYCDTYKPTQASRKAAKREGSDGAWFNGYRVLNFSTHFLYCNIRQ
jgi:hypothetical protein